MSELKALYEAVGFADVRTCIARSNVRLTSRLGESAVRKCWSSGCTTLPANRSAY